MQPTARLAPGPGIDGRAFVWPHAIDQLPDAVKAPLIDALAADPSPAVAARAGLEAPAVPRGALVTSSALLDLVSAEWLEALAARCAAAAAPVLFALNYDGRTTCAPAEPEDAEVLELFNRHQRTDKSFGPALGPTAAASAESAFARHGYRVTARASDWRIPASAAAMQRALVDGWLGAALELAPARRAALTDWHRRRRAHIDAGRSSIVVGHADLLGVPS